MENNYDKSSSLFTPYGCNDSVDVNKVLTMNVATGIELASLSIFSEYYCKLTWRQVFKAGMYSHFANSKGVVPYFPKMTALTNIWMASTVAATYILREMASCLS